MPVNPETTLAERFVRAMNLLTPKNKPLNDCEPGPELPISFWARAGATIGSLRQSYWEYEDYRAGLEEGFVHQSTVQVREPNGSVRLLNPAEVDDEYIFAKSVVHDLKPLLAAVPYDIHDLIPEAARIAGGEELETGVRRIYREFQIARAEEYLGINLGNLASKE